MQTVEGAEPGVDHVPARGPRPQRAGEHRVRTEEKL
jgi:hypothetical protein